jgi:hypothetical protein
MPSRRSRATAVALLGLTAAAAPAAAHAASPPSRVGTSLNLATGSLGALKQGMTPAQAQRLLGKPDTRAGHRRTSDLTLSYGRYQMLLHFSQGTQGGTARLSMIDVRGPQYKTSVGGISTGSSVTQLKAALGHKLTCFSAGHGISAPFCSYESRRGDTLFTIRDKTVTDIQLT